MMLLLAASNKITAEDENEMMHSGVLSIGVVIVVTLVMTMSNNFHGDHKAMALVIFLTFIFVLFTVPDFYFGHAWMPVTRHIRIVFQVLSVATASLAVGLFFINRRLEGWTSNSKTLHIATAELAAEAAETAEHQN